MPIAQAVLALLAERRSHGYELKAAFERSVGPQWGSLNIGHLYQVLARLTADQMVAAQRMRQDDKPDKVVYELTDLGRAEYERWLSEPSVRQNGYRDDFFLKIVAATRHPDPRTLPDVLDRQRGHLLNELRNLGKLAPQHHDDLVVSLLLRAASPHVQADLALLDEVETQLVRTATGGAGPVSGTGDTPASGHPDTQPRTPRHRQAV